MSHHTGSVPETPRAADWRDKGLCREHPEKDLWFPVGSTPAALVQTDAAKRICRHCPVIAACGKWAIETGEDHGVWGGLAEKERRALRRRQARAQAAAREEDTDEDVAEPAAPATLQEAWAQNTRIVPGGHVIWTRNAHVYIQGHYYSPRQLAFLIDRGRPATGRVQTVCEVGNCVLPAHVADYEERTRCGTRGGYRRHLSEGTPIDDACRQANADADNRLRRTGTTKELAA